MTDKLILAYREMASSGGNFHGLSILQHAKQIGKLAREVNAKTMLDFGCGRGDAYRTPHKIYHQWGFSRQNVTLYDPAFKRDSGLPLGGFDLVICSDVLEHIPEEEVDGFIARLFGHANRSVWASVCCRPAKKTFPDGTNLHVTVKPFAWWDEKFQKQSEHEGIRYTLVETP